MGKKLYNDHSKYCPGCKAWLPLDSFHNCRSEPSGRRTRCKKCFKEQNDPHVRKYLYGLDDAQLMALWEKQERRCGICREPIPFRGGQASHIDHDHATGEVRGILCPRCNRGLQGIPGQPSPPHGGSQVPEGIRAGTQGTQEERY